MLFVAFTSHAADWLYLDDGQIRLGVDRAAGASIGYFGERATGRNLLNHHDKGRFIQQSYYGAKDGSDWNGKPWRWNPVQGGGWRGEPARTLAFTNTPTTLYAKTLPKHWATGTDLPEVAMEEWIELRERVAHLRFRMTYNGATNHPPAHQELPAVFADFALTNLVYYKGDVPWTRGALTRRVPGQQPVRLVFSALVAFCGFALTFLQLFLHSFSQTDQPAISPSVSNIGKQMLGLKDNGFALPFEVVSILLLAAMVGSIVIALKSKPATNVNK